MSLAEELGFDFSKENCIKAPFSRFPCRKCIPCLLHRQKAWVSRLTEELRQHENNYFVTLTYCDEYIPHTLDGEQCFDKQHLVKLNKDLRKRFQQGKVVNLYHDLIHGSPEFYPLPKGTKYKFYITTEYGSKTFRPHVHGLWYGLNVDRGTAEVLFSTLWPYGNVSVLPAEEGAAGYISKYLVTDGVGKKQAYKGCDPELKPFALMSKGIGASYVERMAKWHNADLRARLFFQYRGDKGVMDRYLKKRIYPEDFLQELAEEFEAKGNELRYRYSVVQSENPGLYKRLIAERADYFRQMEYDVAQAQSRKQILK